ncbi:DNA-binding response OmpR family regulator [Comamonas sp. BIGb0124]|nr:DNA-binding response OmpR family regulator [Comamonas sp. BIGb0124]
MTALRSSPPDSPTCPLDPARDAACRVLVVDDHRKIRDPLAAYLRREGVDVRTAGDAAAMQLLLQHERFDALVLDVMLPDGDGSLLCSGVQQRYGLPVILLTARGEIDDRVQGLERGADDYLVKPFDPRELLARIRSVIRRRGRSLPPAGGRAEPADSSPTPPGLAWPLQPAADRRPVYRFDNWHLDAALCRLERDDGLRFVLSDTECRLLEVFLNHANTVLSRDDLLSLTQTAGRHAEQAFDRTMDRQVSRLRRKLQDPAREAETIRTVRGGGYVLVSRVTPHNA